MLRAEQEKIKDLGAFYTPHQIADFLATWAIRGKDDKVMDPGAGVGIFVDSALSRFRELGLSPNSAINQIFAIELDKERHSQLISSLKNKHGKLDLKSLFHADFFDILPKKDWFTSNRSSIEVDAVIGNPPYIERQRLKNVKSIQRKVVGPMGRDISLHAVTDIYGYFILHSTSFLRDRGRLAFIVSDTWLNMDFGQAIRDFLVRNYELKAIVGFDSRVFPSALIRTVLLLAEKRADPSPGNEVAFVQLRDDTAVERLYSILDGTSSGNGWAKVTRVHQEDLDPKAQWSKYLKGSKIYFRIERNPRVCRLEDLADMSIGLQTLRKDFFVFDKNKIHDTGLQREFLEPIALGPREIPSIIAKKKELTNYVLSCDLPKEEIKSRKLVDYIKSAERQSISPRGKGMVVRGIQNIPRMKKAGRRPWYNLKPEIERHCRGQILVPRRFYKRFSVVWNKAKAAANEDFVNVFPKKGLSVEALLAVLNSSMGELMCRVHGQLYGGGVFDLRPDDVRALPTLDIRVLMTADISRLERAYRDFILDGERIKIDSIVNELLGFQETELKRLEDELEDLRQLSEISKG
jgi:tRNA1(Val) A37 N6-methylase TrmN6